MRHVVGKMGALGDWTWREKVPKLTKLEQYEKDVAFYIDGIDVEWLEGLDVDTARPWLWQLYVVRRLIMNEAPSRHGSAHRAFFECTPGMRRMRNYFVDDVATYAVLMELNSETAVRRRVERLREEIVQRDGIDNVPQAWADVVRDRILRSKQSRLPTKFF